MKEWDQNDLGKGAQINLPAIQQSVKGKAFPEAAISPLTVTSNSSCFRKAPHRDAQVMRINYSQNPQGEKGIVPLGRLIYSSHGLIYSPSLSNFSPSLVQAPQVNAVYHSMGRWLHHQRYIPTGTISLGSGGSNTLLIPILHVLLMTVW